MLYNECSENGRETNVKYNAFKSIIMISYSKFDRDTRFPKFPLTGVFFQSLLKLSTWGTSYLMMLEMTWLLTVLLVKCTEKHAHQEISFVFS